MIKNISIKNFRSIDNLQIDANMLTAFVGKNDAGKSNLLRAINLFFNNMTDHRMPFSFEKDFNRNANIGKKKAKQIEIELLVKLPESFQKKEKPNTVLWKKVWREGGLHTPLLKQCYSDDTSFSAYSKIPTFLERIAFYYVPAIKDSHFFSDLQGQMYDILAEDAESRLRDSAKEFEVSIKNNMIELMDLVTAQFGNANEIKLPENLRSVFEALEFNADGMPLSRRGDGIKVRHIPMILKFIGEKRNSLLTGGSIKYTNIWGFEEPENNLELSAAFEMARSFELTARNGGQIFITTHSPAFYSISKEVNEDVEDLSIVYGVKKLDGLTQVSSETDDKLHDEVGLMPLIAPFVKKEQERLDRIISEKDAAIRLLENEADYYKPRLFVEGVSDKIIFKKVIELFFPYASENIRVDDGGQNCYGSANAVVSRALAWQLIQQTKPGDVCPAAAVFDGDEAGDQCDGTLELLLEKLRTSKRIIAKSFKLKPSKRLGMLKKSGLNIPNDLESYYSDAVWLHAKDRGWLEDASMAKRLSETIINESIKGNASFREELEEADILRLYFRWKRECKEPAARYVCSLADNEAIDALEDLSLALKECINFLFPSPETD